VAAHTFHFHHWLATWAPLWALFVAAGTLALAGVTGWLAFTTRGLAQQTRDEVRQVGRQVALEEAQLSLAVDPMVWPTAPLDWARGEVDERGSVIHLRNGGNGPALETTGAIRWKKLSGSISRDVTSMIRAVTIAGRDEVVALLDPPVENFASAEGSLTYDSIDEKSWRTTFEFEAQNIPVVCRVKAILDVTRPK
jgi:hypothetical protein